MPSMARRHAFRIRRPLPFPTDCFRQNGYDLQLCRSEKWQLQTGLLVALVGGRQGHRYEERCQQRSSVG